MHKRTLGAVGAVAGAALCLAQLGAPGLTFNLWDNFETFTPMILFAHARWLAGHVPILNAQQSLGVPVMGLTDAGALYFPYAIMLAALRGLALGDQLLPEVIGRAHFVVGFAGWFAVARAMGVRGRFAWLTAAGIAGNGFLILGAQVWHFVGSTYAWLPWCLVGLKLAIDGGPQRRRGFALFAAAWTLAAWGSHVQQLTYAGLHALMFALVCAWPRRRARGARRDLGVLALWTVTLPAPALIYGFAVRAEAPRAGAVSTAEFFEYSLSLKNLVGLLTPAVTVAPGYLGSYLSFMLYGGSWLIIGFGLLARVRSRATRAGLVLMALVFLDCARGEHGLVYPWTQVIPVWASFRYPFKFAPHVVMTLGLGAALGLEHGWSKLSRRRRALALMVVIALPFCGDVRTPALLFWAGAQAALVVCTLGPVGGRRAWPAAAAAALYLTGALVVAAGEAKHHYTETYGAFGAAYFGLADAGQFRLAPLSMAACASDPCVMQPLAQFDAATVNDYNSLSGHQMGMSARAVGSLISPSAWGTVLPDTARRTVGSPLYRALAVRYYLLAEGDVPRYADLLAARGLTERTRGASWRVFEDVAASRLVHVPPVVLPTEIDELDPSQLDAGATPVTRATGWTGPHVTRDTRVGATWWIEGRGLGFDVDNTSVDPSFAVAAIYPWSFLEAWRDGARVPTYRTNLLTTGVEVPPGRHRFELIASVRPLIYALMVAALALLGGGVVVTRRPGDGT